MILKQINQEITDFQNKEIQVVPGLGFNQYQTIEQVILYYNSKFKSGEIDEDGDRKYFFNIVKNPCKVFSKAIDFDTKNIRLITSGGGDPAKTWFMERDLRYWMRDQQFGRVLNRIFHDLPIYGSVVVKIVQGKPYFVDLRNFFLTQSADTLEDAQFITELHNYSIPEFRKAAKAMNWSQESVNKTIDEFRKMKDTQFIRVYERYGEVEDEGKYSYRRVFIADVGTDEYDPYTKTVNAYLGVELSNEEWEGHPYWEFHTEKISGRWLGLGVVETLLEPQIRQNELANLQTKTSYWSALRIFQTRDARFNRNLLDAKNGEVLNVDQEVTQVDMSDRNLAFFNEEYTKWLRNRDELTFSYDVVQGERLPAGTPLGSAQIAIGQTLSYFELIQENVALDVKQMLFDDIIPQFGKENSKEHTLRLVGQDLDAYAEMLKNDLVNKEIIRQAVSSVSGGKFPTEADRDAIGIAVLEAIKQGKEKILTVPKDFYKDVKYDVDIDITGESVDTRVRYATRFALLQAISADPTMTQDPVKRKFLYAMAEDGGLNPVDLFGVESKSPEDVVPDVQRSGGGVSAPALGARVPGEVNATV